MGAEPQIRISDGALSLEIPLVLDETFRDFQALDRDGGTRTVLLDVNDFMNTGTDVIQAERKLRAEITGVFVKNDYLTPCEQTDFMDFFQVYNDVAAFRQKIWDWQAHRQSDWVRRLASPLFGKPALKLDSNYQTTQQDNAQFFSDRAVFGDSQDGISTIGETLRGRIAKLRLKFGENQEREPCFSRGSDASDPDNPAGRNMLRGLLGPYLEQMTSWYNEAIEFLSDYSAVVYTCGTCPQDPLSFKSAPAL